MCATFYGNPCTTIVSSYSSTNASDEMTPESLETTGA